MLEKNRDLLFKERHEKQDESNELLVELLKSHGDTTLKERTEQITESSQFFYVIILIIFFFIQI